MRRLDKILGSVLLYSAVVSPACDTAAKKYLWDLSRSEAAVATALQGMPFPSNHGYDAAHRYFYGEGIYDTLRPINEENNRKAVEMAGKVAKSARPFLLFRD